MTAIVHENISLKPYNTFSIDVTARYFTVITSIADLQTLLADQRWAKMPHLILGGGSNILFTQDFDGLVIQNKIMGIEKIQEDDHHVYLKIGAGENWHQLVLYCVHHHYAGIENLSLIPGTVGAAPIQNIGAYGVELQDTLFEVHAVNNQDHHHVFKKTDCQLGYRDSIFKQVLKNKYVITHVVLKLNKKPIFHVDYGAIKEKLRGQALSIQAVSDAIIQIRQEKLPDPKKIPNAGSFFKNPIVTEEKFLTLQKKYPNMPYFKEQNNHFKIPAAWLIESCGFKGKRFGHVGVHEHQALVLVNDGQGTGGDIKKLSEAIQEAVKKEFGVLLITEVVLV